MDEFQIQIDKSGFGQQLHCFQSLTVNLIFNVGTALIENLKSQIGCRTSPASARFSLRGPSAPYCSDYSPRRVDTRRGKGNNFLPLNYQKGAHRLW